jgi:predicted nucleotidyltransferase
MILEEPIRNIRLEKLIEREKELNCLYNIEETLRQNNQKPDELLRKLLEIIPSGWQYTTICEVEISLENKVFKTEDFRETEWMQSSDIIVDENVIGSIRIAYTQLIRMHRGSQFLPEEQKLLNTIADRLSDYIFFKKLKNTIDFIDHKGNKKTEGDDLLSVLTEKSNEHWKWRLQMSQKIADSIDLMKYSVEGVYVIGSTKNAEAGPASDIDLIIHQNGNEQQKKELKAYIKGWSMALSELNKSKTGYHIPEGIIDLHLVTDDDIKNKDSYATMINSPYNSARPLKTRN